MISVRKRVDEVIKRHPKAYHTAENLGHACYFAFVFVQGHGVYAYMAGVMVVFVGLNIIRSSDHDEA